MTIIKNQYDELGQLKKKEIGQQRISPQRLLPSLAQGQGRCGSCSMIIQLSVLSFRRNVSSQASCSARDVAVRKP